MTSTAVGVSRSVAIWDRDCSCDSLLRVGCRESGERKPAAHTGASSLCFWSKRHLLTALRAPEGQAVLSVLSVPGPQRVLLVGIGCMNGATLRLRLVSVKGLDAEEVQFHLECPESFNRLTGVSSLLGL